MNPEGGLSIMNILSQLPKATRNRMVQLLPLLKAWPSEKITSLDISSASTWKATLIRHDFWLLGIKKGVSNGYLVQELISSIENSLGLKTETTETENTVSKKNCCIVGLGRLGAALLDYSLVDEKLFTIKAGFDSNLNRVEILRSIYPLYPATEMQFVIKKEKIEYAILTVQDKDAQQICNKLCLAGIKGIVNMTQVILTVPDGVDKKSVKIENLSIMNALKMVI